MTTRILRCPVAFLGWAVLGIPSTNDGSATTWNTGNDGSWTLEARLKFNANPNGFMLRIGTDTHRIWGEFYADRTQDNGANSFNVPHSNLG